MPSRYSLRLLLLLAVAVLSEPSPGRIPKVYNALITSNQNLEPSKAYPVYQPVIHDAGFAFPFAPAVYYGGEYPFSGLGSVPLRPKDAPQLTPSAANPGEKKPEAAADTPKADSAPSDAKPDDAPPAPSEAGADKTATPAPPLPPNTESPIPLNQFGLPPQVFPLGRFDPAFDGFTQVGPYYSYPSFKFYDPFDPFTLNPYTNLPSLYRPLSQGAPGSVPTAPPKAPEGTPAPEQSQSTNEASPPPEPSDLNVLNYAAKDPSIPNVEPPPIPSGGLKDDKSE